MAKCLSKSCSCDVLVGRGYCLRHGGPERFASENAAQRRAEAQLRAKRNDSRPRKGRFGADGKVRPGQGLSRPKTEAQKREESKRIPVPMSFEAAITEAQLQEDARLLLQLDLVAVAAE